MTLSDLLKDPTIARELAAKTKAESDAAVAAKVAEIETAAERAKMEETERLKAEKAEEAAKRVAAEKQASDLRIETEFSTAFFKTGKALENPNSIDFIKAEAKRTMEAEGLPMETCVAEVLSKHAYLLQQPPAPGGTPPAPEGTPPAATPPATPPSNVPPTAGKFTETPAGDKPPNAVDTREMTSQEYRAYRQKQHGF